jgi:hypothetical protein
VTRVSIFGRVRIDGRRDFSAAEAETLALLIVREGYPVEADSLADDLEIETSNLRTRISRLRAAWGGEQSPITTIEDSYRFEYSPDTVDLAAFDKLYENARWPAVDSSRLDLLTQSSWLLPHFRQTPFVGADRPRRVASRAAQIGRQREELATKLAEIEYGLGNPGPWFTTLHKLVSAEAAQYETTYLALARLLALHVSHVEALEVLDRARDLLDQKNGAVLSVEGEVLAREISSATDLSASEMPNFDDVHQAALEVPSLDAAAQMRDGQRYLQAIYEAERFVGHFNDLSDSMSAQAWDIVSTARHAMGHYQASVQASSNAVRHAMKFPTSNELTSQVAENALLVLAEGRPNADLVDLVVNAGGFSGVDQRWAACFLAVNQHYGLDIDLADSPADITREAMESAEADGDMDLHRFAARTWLICTDSEPGADLQLAVSDRCLRTAKSALEKSAILQQRAQRRLRLGQVGAFQQDIETLRTSAEEFNLMNDYAVSRLMNAQLAVFLTPQREDLDRYIKATLSQTSRHQLHNEIAAIQLTMLYLTRNPTADVVAQHLSRIEEFASRGRAPEAYSALGLLARLLRDDSDDLPQRLVKHVEQYGLSCSPASARPVTMAALADVAAACGDRDLVSRLRIELEPYSGELVVGPANSIVYGTADGLLAKMSTFLGEGDDAQLYMNRATAMEQRIEVGRSRALAD